MLRSLRFVAVALIIAACGGGASNPTPPIDNTPAAIAIAPAAPITLSADETVQLSATVTARDGRTLSGASVSWSTGDGRVATASAGLVTPSAVGSTTVIATSGTASASVSLTVTVGRPAALAVRSQPTTVALASIIATPLVVEVQDAKGNIETASSAAITVGIASGGGSLPGTTTVAAVAGVATFTDLSFSGATGTRVLSISSPGVTSAAASISVTSPAVPFIVLDSSTISFSTQIGSNPAAKTVRVSNSGLAAFTTVILDPVAYDPGQPTGWLATTISGGATRTVTLTPSAAALPIGAYHATVRVNAAGALNSPLSISVSLTVTQSFSASFAAGDRVKIVDAGAALPPLVALLGGIAQTPANVSFTSRATSVATIDASGRITGVTPGQSWIIAAEQGITDSVFVIVAQAGNGPLLRSDLTTYLVRQGDTLTVTFTLDPRSTTVAAATAIVGYETENSMFTLVAADIPTQSPMPIGSGSSAGLFKINVATATGLTAPVSMLKLTLVARTAGLSGFLTFTVLDAAGTDGGDIAPRFTSTRYPVIIK